ncbi:MAG: hypothetical protein IKL07_07850 [Clostridium sp.]|nr:hypothetical protein [Clostridium sp.]
MLRKCRTIIVLVGFMLCTMLLTSCGDDTDGDVQIISEVSPVPKETDDSGKNNSVVPSKDAVYPEDDGEDSYRNALETSKQLSIYCINEDGTDIESIDNFIDQNAEVNSALVIEQVVNEFSNHKLTIDIDNVKEDEKGSVFVSFKKDTVPVVGVEEEIEYLILDCISQSILDNVQGSNAVIFQIEGDAYKSEHISFKENEAYDWK